MQIVQSVGGFSLGGADLVRRAMGKKIKEEMDKLKGQFASGAEQKGFTKAYAEELFDLIVKFAGYGFNKSHSAAYALITFYTSYLKCYYPAEFMAALLTLEKDNTDKVVRYVDEVKRLGLELFAPDINKSDLVFSARVVDNREVVMFGMGAIKGAGDVAINSILNAREEGNFANLSDFVSRIDASKVNKRVIESLAKAGVFDSFGYSRNALLSQIEKIVDGASKASNAKKMSSGSLFGDSTELTSIEIELDNLPEYSKKEILELEKASLGFYVSGHPLDEYKDKIEKINYTLSSQIDELADGSQILIVGKIETISEKISKKGSKFGIVSILDFHGTVEFMLFEDKLKELQENFDLNEPIAFKVRISKNDQFTRMNVLKIETIFDAQKEKIKIKPKEIEEPPLTVALPFSEDENSIYSLFDLIINNQGKRELKIIIKSKLADLELESGIKVSNTVEKLIHNIKGAYIIDDENSINK